MEEGTRTHRSIVGLKYICPILITTLLVAGIGPNGFGPRGWPSNRFLQPGPSKSSITRVLKQPPTTGGKGGEKNMQASSKNLRDQVPQQQQQQQQQQHTLGRNPSFCVILTGTLLPHSDVDALAQTSQEERTKSYQKSLSHWRNQTAFPHIVFVDNSKRSNKINKLVSGLRQEFENQRLHILRSPSNSTLGNKGIGEQKSVLSALDDHQSPLFVSRGDKHNDNNDGGPLPQCRAMLKITGRFLPPVGLLDALGKCPPETKLIVQRYKSKRTLRQPMESQLFGWVRGSSEFEVAYRHYGNRQLPEFAQKVPGVEKFLFSMVKKLGNCTAAMNVEDDAINSCNSSVCFVGPLTLPKPVVRGGSGELVNVI